MNNQRIDISIFGNEAIVTVPNTFNNSSNKKTLKVESLVKAFQDKATGISSPIMPTGTIKYKEKGNKAYIYVYSAPTFFDANYKSEVFEKCPRPGIVMRFELNANKGNFTLSNTYVWSVKDDPLFFNDNTKLYCLPFPNVNSSGWVCWGSNNLSGTFKSLCGLSTYIPRLFNAPFNNDLFQGAMFRHVGFTTPKGMFEFLSGKEIFPNELYVEPSNRVTLGNI